VNKHNVFEQCESPWEMIFGLIHYITCTI